MNLRDILTIGHIKVPLDSADKKSAIDELVDVLASDGHVNDADTLKRIVWEREMQRSTGIGEGLAIPHGKSTDLTQLHMAIGKPAQPIEFGAIDCKPVQLIVLLVSPSQKTAEHIQALGKISRLMADRALRDQIYNAPSSEILFGLLESAEQ